MTKNKGTIFREKSGGILYTGLKVLPDSTENLSAFYSPGVAEASLELSANPEKSKTLTGRKNTIAIVSDGSAVLGLGNIGPEGALPVMEGKAMLFKHFGDVDAVPLVLKTQNTEEIIKTIEALSPSFGGINLEDIAAPRCFDIQKQLSEKLDIPVFHDDQDGTAMVVVAGIINSLKVVQKKWEDLKITICGGGAAGLSIARLISKFSPKTLLVADSKGIICDNREDLTDEKKVFSNPVCGTLAAGVKDSDIFIGVSRAGLLTEQMVSTMAPNAIVFALANPTPEIMPEEAYRAGAKIVATGRSDFPNQINNVLIFPGLFRGLLDGKISLVTDEIKIAGAEFLASQVQDPTPEKIIPSPLEKEIPMLLAEKIVENFGTK